MKKSFIYGSTISVFLLIVVILLMFRLYRLASLIRFPMDKDFFFLECAYYAAMIHLLIFSLSTWLYNSNFHKSRFQARIFMAAVIVVYVVIIFIFTSWVADKLAADKPMKFDNDIWDHSTDLVTGPGIELYLLLICAIIMIVYIIWNLAMPQKEHWSDALRVRHEEDVKMQSVGRN